MKRIFYIILLFLVVIAVSTQLFQQSGSAPVKVRIAKGMSSRKIAQVLADHHVIRSPVLFLVLARISGRAKDFKHGLYLLETGRYWKTIDQLSKGLNSNIKVTIPEGWSSWKIAERLYQSGIITDMNSFEAMVQQLKVEGRLFPETYSFEPESDPQDIIQEMEDQFKYHYTPQMTQRAHELKMTDLQVLTLASIIEREAQIRTEKPLISSVYHNRLAQRKLLQADPTVQYALSRGKEWKKGLTYKDLKIKSPYNTYQNIGLPPAPICNPGLESIQAALYPAQTESLYFFADGTGGHNFSKSYREHMQKQGIRSREAGK